MDIPSIIAFLRTEAAELMRVRWTVVTLLAFAIGGTSYCVDQRYQERLGSQDAHLGLLESQLEAAKEDNESLRNRIGTLQKSGATVEHHQPSGPVNLRESAAHLYFGGSAHVESAEFQLILQNKTTLFADRPAVIGSVYAVMRSGDMTLEFPVAYRVFPNEPTRYEKFSALTVEPNATGTEFWYDLLPAETDGTIPPEAIKPGLYDLTLQYYDLNGIVLLEQNFPFALTAERACLIGVKTGVYGDWNSKAARFDYRPSRPAACVER